jgi:hypothetical protein
VARTLAEQIRDAYEASTLTLDEIKERSGLDIDRASLSRKLRVKQKLWTDECEALAKVFKVVVSAGKRAA